MSTNAFALSIVYLLAGGLLMFAGAKIMKLAITLWGFLFGVWLGVWAGNVFRLPDTTFAFFAIVIGLIVSVISFGLYRMAVAATLALFVFSLVLGLFGVIGMETGLAFVTALIIGAFTYFVVYRKQTIKALFAVATATQGAASVVVGLALLMNADRIKNLSEGSLHFVINEHFLWTVLWLTLSGFGIYYQLRQASETKQTGDKQPDKTN